MMSAYLVTVASMWAIATISPGPNFITIAQIGAAQPRPVAIAAVAGTGVATLIWGLCGVLGVQALFAAAPWAYMALKIGGACYLIYMGVRMVFRSFSPRDNVAMSADAPTMSLWRGYMMGLASGLANPRSALSVASVFAVALRGEPTFAMGSAAIAVMITVSVSWYALLAFLFTMGPVKRGYRQFGHWLDRVAGGLLVFLGLRLALQTK